MAQRNERKKRREGPGGICSGHSISALAGAATLPLPAVMYVIHFWYYRHTEGITAAEKQLVLTANIVKPGAFPGHITAPNQQSRPPRLLHFENELPKLSSDSFGGKTFIRRGKGDATNWELGRREEKRRREVRCSLQHFLSFLVK